MKNKMFTTMLVAVLATLFLADAASAYYSPRMGRFLNRDPIGEPGAVLVHQTARPVTGFIPRDSVDGKSEGNLYRCVDNNAIIFIDPYGLHVIGVGVAQAFGASHGQKWRDTVSELARFEQSLYDELGVGDRYNNGQLDYFDNPASSPTFPNWQKGINGLKTRVEAFNGYYAKTRMRKCKAEIVHVLGYSDGATVISRWLNANAPGTRMISVPWGELPYGTVGLVDIVRNGNELLGPNQSPGMTYQVATSGYFYEHTSFSSEGGKWKGYRIVTGWSHQTYTDIDHKLVAYDERVKAALKAAIEFAVREELNGQASTSGW